MKAIDYVKLQTEQAFGLLKMAADGMDDVQYNLDGPGTCNAAAKSHVHALTAFDFFVMNKAKGAAACYGRHSPRSTGCRRTRWRSGATAPSSPARRSKSSPSRSRRPRSTTSRRSRTTTLTAQVDTQFFGTQPLAFLLQLASMHAAGHAGDVAAVKGTQGLKGLPF